MSLASTCAAGELEARPGDRPVPTGPRREWWLLGGILAVALLLDVVFFNGYFASDDFSYFTAAQDILQLGHYHAAPGLGSSRLTMVGWLTLVGLILPPDVQWAAASFIAWHLLLIGLTYLLGRSLFDGRVGLLGAWGVATIGLFVAYAGCILPDIPVGCTWVLALYAFQRGLRARQGPRPYAAHAWLLAAGLSVGIGYMAKEVSLVLLPFFFVVWLAAERRFYRPAALARGAAFAIGVGVMLAAETLTLRQVAPQSAARLSWTVNQLDEDVQAAVDRYGTDPWRRLRLVNQRLDRDVLPAGLKAALIAGCVLFPVVCRRSWALCALPLWVFAYHTWGTMNLTVYAPPSIQARYYIPLMPFALLALAAVLVRAWDRTQLSFPHGRRAAHSVVLASVALYPLSGLDGPNRVAGKLYRADVFRSSAEALVLARQRPARPIVVARALSGRVAPMLRWQQAQDDVLWLPPLPTDVSDIPITASDPMPVVSAPGAALAELPDLAAPLRVAGTRWQLLGLNPLQWPLPTDPLMEMCTILHWPIPRRLWNLADRDELTLQFDDCRFCVKSVTRVGLSATRLDELYRAWRGEPPFLTTPTPGGGRGVVLYELSTDRTPPAYDASIDLPLDPASWRPGIDAEADLIPLAEGLAWRAPPNDAGHAWLVPVETTFDACRSVPSKLGTFFVVDVESTNARRAELVVDALTSDGKPRPESRRRLYLRDGKNVLVAHNPTGETTWRPCFKLDGDGELRLRRMSVAHAPVQACRNFNAEQRHYRVTSPGESPAPLHPLLEGGFRVALNRSRNGYHWLVPARQVRQPLLEMAASTRYDFHFSVQQADTLTAQLVLQFYDGPDMQNCVDERRTLLRSGLNEISITTATAAAYPYLVYKIFEYGEFAVLSLQCVVTAPEP